MKRSNQSYTIAVSNTNTEQQQFADFLNAQGYNAKLSSNANDYINGYAVVYNTDDHTFLDNLWNQYNKL
jgi:hypothetical protein